MRGRNLFYDYYPFGMLLPNTNIDPNTGVVLADGDYRYGLQGQEKDDEVSGEGNSYTAEYWQYDSRLGRRWNLDPVVKTHESPYATFANNPIWFVDPSGADSTLYLFVGTDNEGFSQGTGNVEAVGEDALGIFKANGVDWINKVKVVYDRTEFEGISSNLDMTDGIVEYTDNVGLANTTTRGFGNTKNFFHSYIYIGAAGAISKANLGVIGYSTAHEFLHQIVGRIGYFVYGNVSFYQGYYGHWEGGLLTDANDMGEYSSGVLIRPQVSGTGIEEISNEMIMDVRVFSLLVNSSQPVFRITNTSSSNMLMRYQLIMTNDINFNITGALLPLQNNNYGIQDDAKHYSTYNKETGKYETYLKPIYKAIQQLKK